MDGTRMVVVVSSSMMDKWWTDKLTAYEMASIRTGRALPLRDGEFT